MTSMVSLGENRGRGLLLNFLGAPMILSRKKCIPFGNESLRWLNNVPGVYLVQVSLLLIGLHGLGHFFKYRPLLPIGRRIVQILRQRRRKTTNTAPNTHSAIQAAPIHFYHCIIIIHL
jgi:hypothetical protein